MALRAKVVDLVWLHLLNGVQKTAGVRQIAVMQNEFSVAEMGVLVEMIDTIGVEQRTTALDAVDLVALAEQELRQIGSILAGDPGNQCSLCQFDPCGPGNFGGAISSNHISASRSLRESHASRGPDGCWFLGSLAPSIHSSIHAGLACSGFMLHSIEVIPQSIGRGPTSVCQNECMEAIVLAGGLGTRLASRLNQTPKSMAPVGGRPFLEILLDQLIAAGCSRIILSVGHLRDAILQRFQNRYRDVPIDYAIEESPLGTGGAIRLALSQALEPSVLVVNGDTYLEADLSALARFHRSSRRSLTMAVVRVADTARYGGVLIEDQIISGFSEKGRTGPGWINGGFYVIDKSFPWHADLPARFSFETDVLVPFLSEIRPAAFRCEGYFLDIGIPQDFDRAQVELARSH